eukprot:TRINITY_DN12712_c0_g1_i1.p1 TRINITY_DN12712_c0_g1~~TRINITY_DN12712_c0_g1_i1.p1  ORF type:complete len:122 (+),score=4.28 TRINITY_DN12712_c0_g1_i1:41-367(+)
MTFIVVTALILIISYISKFFFGSFDSIFPDSANIFQAILFIGMGGFITIGGPMLQPFDFTGNDGCSQICVIIILVIGFPVAIYKIYKLIRRRTHQGMRKIASKVLSAT